MTRRGWIAGCIASLIPIKVAGAAEQWRKGGRPGRYFTIAVTPTKDWPQLPQIGDKWELYESALHRYFALKGISLKRLAPKN